MSVLLGRSVFTSVFENTSGDPAVVYPFFGSELKCLELCFPLSCGGV